MSDLPSRDNPKTEPNAELREFANFAWQTYTALTDEGFSEMQALIIIGNMVRPNKGDT